MGDVDKNCSSIRQLNLEIQSFSMMTVVNNTSLNTGIWEVVEALIIKTKKR